jgi:hypothetical protein
VCSVYTNDAPYGDHFHIADVMEAMLTQKSPPVTRVRFHRILRFTKSTWFKSIIKSKTIEQQTDTLQCYVKEMKRICEAHRNIVQILLRQEQLLLAPPVSVVASGPVPTGSHVAHSSSLADEAEVENSSVAEQPSASVVSDAKPAASNASTNYFNWSIVGLLIAILVAIFAGTTHA